MKSNHKLQSVVASLCTATALLGIPSLAVSSENATCYTGYAVCQYATEETAETDLSSVLSPEVNAVEIVAECIGEMVENQTEVTREEVAAGVTKPQKSDYIIRSDLSTQQTIYFYLTENLGYSQAGACGIMANIKAECNYNCHDVTGKYYGLFQLTDGRLANMKKYCNARGLSWKTIQGQISWMDYELNGYPALKKLLKSASGEEGARKAAYQFSIKYERPAGKEKSASKRAASAAVIYNARSRYGSSGRDANGEKAYQAAMDKYNAEVDRLYAIAVNQAIYNVIAE